MLGKIIYEGAKGRAIDFNGNEIDIRFLKNPDAWVLAEIDSRARKRWRKEGIIPRQVINFMAESLGICFIAKDSRGSMKIETMLQLLRDVGKYMMQPGRGLAEWIYNRIVEDELCRGRVMLTGTASVEKLYNIAKVKRKEERQNLSKKFN